MQGINPPTPDQLRAVGQRPLLKLEAFIRGSWVNFCNLHSAVDLVGYWPFDEGAGMVAYDKSKEENDGSLENMEEGDWVDGKVGKCLEFDGINDYVEVPDDNSLDNVLTFAAWVKPVEMAVDTTYYRPIVVKHSTGYRHGLIYDTRTGANKFRAYFRDGISASNASWSIPAFGVWYHVVAVYDDGYAKLYVNGELKDTGNLITGHEGDNGEPVRIGGGVANRYIETAIDEVRLYKRVLPASEIKALFELEGKNYLESISLSHAGAGMSPNPIAATLSAEINNEDAIFHPKHPTSAYSDYFKAGRKVRISVGAKYGVTDYYWQRIIGYIDTPKFSGKTFKVSISGLDYMKTLADTKFRKTELPPDNYWGDMALFSTYDPDPTLGPEIYTEEDAMDEDDAGHDNVDPWNVRVRCTFASIAATSGQSNFEGVAFTTDMEARIENPNVGNAAVGGKYRVTFWYKKVAGSALPMKVGIYQDIGGTDIKCGGKSGLAATEWTPKTFYFTALKTGILIMKLTFEDTGQQFRIDHISIKTYDDPGNAPYVLPVGATGVHYVELDESDGFLPVWPGKQKKGDEGWYYISEDRQLFFEDEKEVEEGIDNLKIYYYTEQSPENVVADLMFKAGLYVDQAAALAAMEETATGFTIPQVWFDAGKSFLDAIKKLCERCDYRFYFKHNGTPVFKPVPSPKAPGNEDLVFEKQHISEPEYYEDRNEIRNRIVIEGLKHAQEGAEETMGSELKGTAVNEDSIDDYGEHTLSIKNHLFQDQTSIDDMCATLLARYKDPMWYLAFDTPFNPAPLEIWDTIKAELLLKTATIPGLRYGSFKYDSGVRYGSEDTAIDVRGLIRDIKIDKHNITYKCEEVT